ncbi:hypothetical protein DYB32_004902 [Aphanomyces invadans]|uniref:Uncharacterized protein n=1 Tax=Aphanomyces invadans TaxID=157072 RepID=A0A418AW31_9STRA|nr:hypothetical protein DYB32_004902 [Aphanomyces invadans]
MHEQLRFVLDKVAHVSAHRYQKWFQASFLHVQPSDGRIADIVRFVCVVHQPTNQAVEAKMTPRYHILGWLLLLKYARSDATRASLLHSTDGWRCCSKSPSAKARVLHAMFFDFFNYSQDVPVLHLEPAMMLLVSAAISALIKVGMMRNLVPLVDYLHEFNPTLGKQCQDLLPAHFNARPPGNVAVETTCLRVVPYLFQHAPAAYMPRVDALVRALISVATPTMLAKLSMRLLLKDFSMFRDHQITNVLLSSLQWNSWEQWGVWELVASEWEAKKKDKATVAALRKVLACLDPHTHGEALSGILRLLVQVTPDMALFHCVMKLSDAFDPFPCSVLSIWSDKALATVQSFLVVVLRENHGKDALDVCRQLNKMPPTNALLQDSDIRAALLSLVGNDPSTGESFPVLFGQLASAADTTTATSSHGDPVAKKPRLDPPPSL